MAGKKRGQNEGTIYKRKDGRWEGAVTLPGTGGKRKRFYGETQREVREQMTAALRALDQGEVLNTDRQTVEQFLDRWLTEVVKPSVRAKTHHSYSQMVRLHLAPGIGKHQLAKLSPQHIQAFMNAKLAVGLAPRTVQYQRAVLRRALGQALKWGLVNRNVATLVDPPSVPRGEMQSLTLEQAKHFLDTVRGDRQEALYTVALSLGLRQGEALGLRWEDVDLDNGSLRVAVALQRINGQPARLVEPKTKQSRRTLPIPAPLVGQLRAHRVRQLEERLQSAERWEGEQWDLVFANRRGKPLDPTHVVKSFKAHLSRATLPSIRFHDLRHTAASLLVAQGIHPREVMEILGHSTITLTMNTYAHVMPLAKRAALDALSGTLFTGTEGAE
jgi:integrase